MTLVYNVGKTTERYINLGLEMQNIIPREEITEPFKRFLNHWIDERVPACMRTKQSINNEESESCFQLHLNDFLVKFKKKEIGYSYRKGKNFEELQIRESPDYLDWIVLDRRSVC